MLNVRILKLLIFLLFITLGSVDVATAGTVPPDFVALARQLKPTVVNISTSKTISSPKRFYRRPPNQFGVDPFEDFFERFFEEPQRRPRKERSLGSGFIISGDGYILTNNHVVAGADEIKVKLANGQEFKGEIKGLDEKLDLALIKIEAKNQLAVSKLGDSDAIEIGEWVMAIGNPFGLEQTVTAGIISAKGRVIGSGPYDDFIQTDASINPGNSGGPLFNASGEVIGINTAIVAGGQGIGFAIPVNMAKAIIPQLREKGKVTRGWLGISVQPITPELAQSFGLADEKGALVTDVSKDSPAEKAGLKSGDIVLEFEGKSINEMNELPRLVAVTEVGKQVTIKLLRNGKIDMIPVTVSRMPDSASEETALHGNDKLGMTVRELTKELAAQLGLKEGKGVVVTNVQPDSIAAGTGIRPGDIVREINGVKIESLTSYEKAVSGVRKGNLIRLLLKRGENTFYVAVKME